MKERGTLNFEVKDFSLEAEEEKKQEEETLSMEENNQQSSNSSVVLRVEEVVAMILRHAKEMSDKFGSVSVSDCIITIPSNWNMNQRNVFA